LVATNSSLLIFLGSINSILALDGRPKRAKIEFILPKKIRREELYINICVVCANYFRALCGEIIFNMHLFIGLGNFGKEYEKTRHNFGFLALDQIILDYNFQNLGKKFSSEIFAGEIDGKKIIALKPQTYMNNSGVAALSASTFYKIPPQNIIVFHDEVDIHLGKIKVKIDGGAAGHNGIKSLDSAIGKEYWRVRLGVGRPENAGFELSDYVLSRFTKDEILIVEEINKKVSAAITFLINGEVNLFTNQIAL